MTWFISRKLQPFFTQKSWEDILGHSVGFCCYQAQPQIHLQLKQGWDSLFLNKNSCQHTQPSVQIGLINFINLISSNFSYQDDQILFYLLIFVIWYLQTWHLLSLYLLLGNCNLITGYLPLVTWTCYLAMCEINYILQHYLLLDDCYLIFTSCYQKLTIYNTCYMILVMQDVSSK